jgi:hypothetical protein
MWCRLLEKRLHLIEEPVSVRFHRHAAFLRKLHEQFLLTGRELGGDLHFNCVDVITGLAALETGDAEAFDLAFRAEP